MIGAHDFIAALPEGYDTPVGKRSRRLSAAAPADLVRTGVPGRPGCARPRRGHLPARHPERATGAGRTAHVLAGRTAVIIAHRLSTVAIANRVLVLDRGQITEDGPPSELMSGDGEYAALHSSWAASLA